MYSRCEDKPEGVSVHDGEIQPWNLKNRRENLNVQQLMVPLWNFTSCPIRRRCVQISCPPEERKMPQIQVSSATEGFFYLNSHV